MKRSTARVKVSRSKRSARRTSHPLHKKIYHFFKGSGGIYVIIILTTIMVAAYMLSGGFVPKLNPSPAPSDMVKIDEAASKPSNEKAIQIIALKGNPVTPTPTPIPPPPASPTPTKAPSCFNNAAIAMLVDESFSMSHVDGSRTKMENLKAAIRSFSQNFTASTVIGLFAFSAPNRTPSDPRVIIPFSMYSTTASTFASKLDGLIPQGGTHMKDGFQIISNRIPTAKSTFPNHKFFVVFFSDGIPETDACPYDPNNQRYQNNCASSPLTHPQSPMSVVSQIEGHGVKVFSIALYGSREGAGSMAPVIRQVMTDIASDPTSTYYLESPTSDGLTSLYQTVGQRICQ